MSPPKNMAPATLPSRKTRKDFQRLAELRAKEAATLAETGNQQGAYYFAGFAVECALKACIAEKVRRQDFPADKEYAGKIYSHNPEQLFKLAHLEALNFHPPSTSRAVRFLVSEPAATW
jgi:HEPN domain-containing protein